MAAIGETLSGTYKLVGLIGSGGFATVYRARDMRAGTVVAVKILHPHHAADAQIVRRFRREAEVADSLRHPNIVRMLDFGEDDETVFLVMEYVYGHTLASLLEREGQMTLSQTMEIATQALDALDTVHRAGIIHRDIKPHNIMLTPERRLKLMDLGLARPEASSGITQAGTYMGTVHYIAPELVLGSPADIRADLYALGITLYQCLAATVPFDAPTPMAILHMHVAVAPPSLSRVRPDLPPEFVVALERSLAKLPEHRYQTPSDMLLGLQGRWDPVAAPPPLPMSGATAPPIAPSVANAPTPQYDPQQTAIIEAGSGRIIPAGGSPAPPTRAADALAETAVIERGGPNTTSPPPSQPPTPPASAPAAQQGLLSRWLYKLLGERPPNP